MFRVRRNTGPRSSGPSDSFSTTRWSIVFKAGDSGHPASRQALEWLCGAYWRPVYAYVRRKGHDADSAPDLVQGFFVDFLERRSFERAVRSRGRFRSYLLGAVNHYLLNEWDRARTQKRGGGEAPLSLDLARAEQRCWVEPADEATPETIYERHWALTVLERTLTRLRQEKIAAGQVARFDRLQPLLTAEGLGVPYRELAAELGTSEGALKMEIHRLRQRYGQLLREEIAQTLPDASEVDAELRHLIAALGK